MCSNENPGNPERPRARRRRWPAAMFGLVMALGAASNLVAIDKADWELLLEARFFGPIPVPDEGVVLDIDSARFRLRSGSLWLQTPVSSGAVTGLVFEGDGHLLMDVADALELQQLRRFVEDEEIERVEQPFDRLVLQTSFMEIVELLGELSASIRKGPAVAASSGPSAHPLVLDRHEKWFEHYRYDPLARTLAALRNLGGRYAHIEIDTKEHGWLVVEYDDHRSEELTLQHFETRGSFLVLLTKMPYPTLVTWLSLDRRQDRNPHGGPARRPNHGARLFHLDAEIDLTKPGREPRQGYGRSHSVEALLRATPHFRSLRDGLGALRLQLDPMSVVGSVRRSYPSRPEGANSPKDPESIELEILRYNTGADDLTLDDRLHNRELVVLLDQPLIRGEEVTLSFEIKLDLIDHAGGLHWYPTPVESDFEAHTAELTFRHRRDMGVVAVGENLGTHEANDGRLITRWRLDTASTLVGFSFAQRPHSVRVEHEGLPPITFFGTTNGFLSPKRIGRLEGDVVDTLLFFCELFGMPMASPELIVSFIESDAQAFPGLIQLWNGFLFDGGALGSNDHGHGEHFLAHELAHLWWGHQIGWASYRDYWLVESLAQYSAFLYVESELERGDQVAGRILNAYTDSVVGSLKSRFDSFASWGLAFGSMSSRSRSAPLSHGVRATLSESPGGAYASIYRKGMLVLHMIRMQALAQTGDDQAFFAILRDYAHRFRGAKPSSIDFRNVVADHLEGDWQRFFSQWVDGAEVPTLRWSHSTRQDPDDGDWLIAFDVQRKNVPPDFVVEVPVLVELADGTSERRLVTVGDGSTQVEVRVAEPPHKVTFNESHGALARMRLRDRGARKAGAP